MAGIVRSATIQAIIEIVSEHATPSRFGYVVSEENLKAIAERVVDLMETTLELRKQSHQFLAALTGGGAGERSPEESPQPQRSGTLARYKQPIVSDQGPFPRSRNAAEIYDTKKWEQPQHESVALPPKLDAKLPRKKVSLTPEELEKLKN